MNKALEVIRNPKLFIILLLGFSSGLPFLLVGGTLKAWLTQSGVDLATVGLFAFVRTPYLWKFLWSPIFDRYQVSKLGRRRSWMIISQIGLMGTLIIMAHADPREHLFLIVLCAVVTSFFSASQDIVIDAYRREILSTEELGLGSSIGVFGYRLGMMLSSGGAFLMAAHISWGTVYQVLAAFMLVGLVTALLCPEPTLESAPPKSLKESVIGPLVEFFKRDKAWTILAFIFLYKVGESLASEMYNPFYIQLGFTNTEIGAVTKFFAVWAMIIGGIAGGALIIRWQIYKSLWIFGILQSIGLLLFMLLAYMGRSLSMLSIAIGFENFASGMATSAFVAFIASQTKRRFTAVQYSLLSSFGVSLPSVLLGGASGILAKVLGWPGYFLFCTILTIPGLIILFRVKHLIFSSSKADG